MVKQVHYPAIEIDNNEKDIVQIWQNGKEDSNVIQVERGKMDELISKLVEAKNVPVTKAVYDYDWVKPGVQAWISSIFLMPTEVTIIGVNRELKVANVKTENQSGVVVGLDRLYKTEKECPCR